MTHGDPSGHGLLVAHGYAPLALAAYLLCGWIHGEPWERRIKGMEKLTPIHGKLPAAPPEVSDCTPNRDLLAANPNT
ncbi:hypothetical protein PVAP13_2NG078100 [Panicum virgatum]|uniref:Uncharacterized protein n=1 Tax=Panicum virgatum TaxID=38727 RepID=A0A8T0VI84_PANVG|nr:hypothetical protein PVAP13_2NG078100 [Panicum virgatum]